MATAAKAAKSRIVGMAQGVLESKAVVIAQIRSNKTAMCNELRAELSKSDGKLKFLKNSLASVAAKKVTDVKKGGSFPKVSPSTSFIFSPQDARARSTGQPFTWASVFYIYHWR